MIRLLSAKRNFHFEAPTVPFEFSHVTLFGPEGDVQAYLDRQSLRRHLQRIQAERPIRTALEVGTGYGRLTMVLSEFAREVYGIEREEGLIRLARALSPHIVFFHQDAAGPFPLGDGSCDFAMTFLVLQHMPLEDCRRALEEIKRVTAPQGHVLLVEKVVPGKETKNASDRRRFISRHRPVKEYQELMAPFAMVDSHPRPVEPLYRFNPGGFMLFRRTP